MVDSVVNCLVTRAFNVLKLAFGLSLSNCKFLAPRRLDSESRHFQDLDLLAV